MNDFGKRSIVVHEQLRGKSGISTQRRIAPVFRGVNLDDISAPRCFEIEDRLQDLGIPVFRNDQHCTVIVLFAAMLNAAKLVGNETKVI